MRLEANLVRARATLARLHRGLGAIVAPVLAVLALVAAGGSTAQAQEPDVRNIRPAVMLLVDTSGSMEYALNARSGAVAGRVADCSRAERDRWVSLVEVLTGRIPSFSCTSMNRRISYPGAPDQYYPLHYALPRSAGNPFVAGGPFPQENGILDTYLERVKFGLMVYDNLYGLYTGVDEDLIMMPEAAFIAAGDAWNRGVRGDFSYGPNRRLTFPGCAGAYMVNAGARHDGLPSTLDGSTEMIPPAAGGALVSFGVDTAADPNLFRTVNASIQQRLLTTRPYGSTPTAALLQDYEFYLNNHPDAAPPVVGGALDRLAACRPQYAILITDGQPSDPFRSTMRCDTPGYTCPYDRSADIVSRLCGVGADGRCTSSRFRGLFAVLFQPGTAADADVAQATTIMNQIASVGGTCRTPGACAYLATDPASLSAAITAALDRASPGARTRTTPSFGSVSLSGGGQGQFEITSGFLVGDHTQPWHGVLNRQRIECDGTVPVTRALAPRDRFFNTLNLQPSRNIRTVVTADPTHTRGIIIGPTASSFALPAAPTGSTTRTTVSTMQPFVVGNGSITPQHFALAGGDTTQRNASITWVRADAGSGRESHRLGDIYHSNPVIVTAPTADISDASFNLFRRRPEIAGRPPMVYFGTNDGIIHAMVLADHTTPAGINLSEGQELWGFVPPAVMPLINDARSAHQFLADGAPVVRDLFFRRRPGDLPSGADYHTVMLMGLRQGGNSYVALDVTDPERPVFLWQWTHDDMGRTFGRPALTQALVDLGSGPEERAVAILPGGAGTRGVGACTLLPSNRAPRSAGQTADSRPQNSCWVGGAGRSFHVVDVATGERIRSWDATTIQTPMTGAVSLFTGQTGSISTRAYVTTADGVLWRLDMSSPNPTNWTFRPLHDLYWYDGALAGHASHDPPVVSIDGQRRPIIILGTGDPENFETPGNNYVVSLAENATAVPFVATAEINWEIRLRPQEMVTGPIELFDGRVYFGTFVSGATAANACEVGSSRLWGVDYQRIGLLPSGYPTPGSNRSPYYGWESAAAAGTGVFSLHYMDLGRNQIIQGVGVTQRPSCIVGSTIADPYVGPRFDVDQVGGGQFELVAQVSSDSDAAGGGAPDVATIRRTLPTPISYTRTIGQALVDF